MNGYGREGIPSRDVVLLYCVIDIFSICPSEIHPFFKLNPFSILALLSCEIDVGAVPSFLLVIRYKR